MFVSCDVSGIVFIWVVVSCVLLICVEVTNGDGCCVVLIGVGFICVLVSCVLVTGGEVCGE